ncbi:MAG: hypothetical protein M3P51_08805 [Chloroflexota bacterium]|nr:hypothetical protein [Chloroflexota bacterium]
MDRKKIAWYSYLALAMVEAALLISFWSIDPYADQSVLFEVIFPVILILFIIHFWYFRREFDDLRHDWVQHRPWLRYFIHTNQQTVASPHWIMRSALWFVLLVMLITLWMFFRPSH